MQKPGTKETCLKNAEYDAAKEAQGILEAKIATLKKSFGECATD